MDFSVKMLLTMRRLRCVSHLPFTKNTATIISFTMEKNLNCLDDASFAAVNQDQDGNEEEEEEEEEKEEEEEEEVSNIKRISIDRASLASCLP